jgi:hypothetical protein
MRAVITHLVRMSPRLLEVALITICDVVDLPLVLLSNSRRCFPSQPIDLIAHFSRQLEEPRDAQCWDDGVDVDGTRLRTRRCFLDDADLMSCWRSSSAMSAVLCGSGPESDVSTSSMLRLDDMVSLM